MSKRLKSQTRRIKTGCIFVCDAVLLLAKAVNPEPFESNLFQELYPFCFEWDVKEGKKVRVPARIDWWREKDGTYEASWKELDAPSSAYEELERDWRRLYSSLDILVRLVLDGHIKGRIEHVYRDLIPLDSDRAPRFRGQRITAYCSSFIALSDDDATEIPALVSFERTSLDAAIAAGLHLQIDSMPSSSIRKRNWVNRETRHLSAEEKQRLEEATERFTALGTVAFGDKAAPRFPLPKLATFFAEVTSLPTEFVAERPHSDNLEQKRVAYVTVWEAIKAMPHMSKFLARHGGPRKNELAQRQIFFERLAADETFDKYIDFLRNKKE